MVRKSTYLVLFGTMSAGFAGCVELPSVQVNQPLHSVQCDLDGDGIDGLSCGGTDCDDGSERIYPGALEMFGDGLDQNCNGDEDLDRSDIALPGSIGRISWAVHRDALSAGGPARLETGEIGGIEASLVDGAEREFRWTSYPTTGFLLEASRRVGGDGGVVDLLALEEFDTDRIEAWQHKQDGEAAQVMVMEPPQDTMIHSVDGLVVDDNRLYVVACSDASMFFTVVDLAQSAIVLETDWVAPSTQCRMLSSENQPMVVTLDSVTGTLNRWRLSDEGPFDALEMATGLEAETLVTSSAGRQGYFALIEGGDVLLFSGAGDGHVLGSAGEADEVHLVVRSDGALAVSWSAEPAMSQIAVGGSQWDLGVSSVGSSSKPVGIGLGQSTDQFRVLFEGDGAVEVGLAGWSIHD